MRITPQQNPDPSTDPANTTAKRSPNQGVSTPAATSAQPPTPTSTPTSPLTAATKAGAGGNTPASAASAPTTTVRPTAVTFRRDNTGQVYYIVSDAHTGDEILEVPPKAVRDAGQGIEDYLKSQQSNATATARIAVKA